LDLVVDSFPEPLELVVGLFADPLPFDAGFGCGMPNLAYARRIVLRDTPSSAAIVSSPSGWQREANHSGSSSSAGNPFLFAGCVESIGRSLA
jgi:hypothetical protein